MGLLCLWIVARTVDPATLGALLARCRPGPLVLAALLYLSGSLVGAVSWKVILRALGHPIGLGPATRLTLVGFVLNNLIPGGVAGDVYRALGADVPRTVGAVSVVVERWAAFLALLVATAVSYALAFPLLHGVTVQGGFRLDVLMAALLAALTVFFLVSTRWAMRAEADRFGATAGEFVNVLEGFRGHRRAFLVASFLNLWSPVLEGLAFSCAAAALGASLSPLLFLAFTPVFRVVTHLPLSVNAVGTQEVASLLLWEPLGASAELALGISLLMHALKIAVSLLGLPFYLLGAGVPAHVREGPAVIPQSAEGGSPA